MAFSEGIVVMHVPMRDSSGTDISELFDAVVRSIQEVLETDEQNTQHDKFRQPCHIQQLQLRMYIVFTEHMLLFRVVHLACAALWHGKEGAGGGDGPVLVIHMANDK